LFTSLVMIKVSGQDQRKIDSMLKVLPAQADDSTKVKTILRIAQQYLSNNPQKTIKYSSDAATLAEKVEWKKGFCVATSMIGDSYYYQGNFSECLKYRIKELELWKELGYEKQICGTYGNIGVVYSDLGNNLKALEFYQLALKRSEKNKFEKTTAQNLSNIGILFYQTDNFERAIEYLERAIEIDSKDETPELLASCYTSLGKIYSKKKQSSLAIQNYLLALSIDEKQGRNQNLSMILSFIGDEYVFKGDSLKERLQGSEAKTNYLIAIDYYTKALAALKEIGNTYYESYINGRMGTSYVLLNDFKKAEDFIHKAMDTAVKFNYTDLIKEHLHEYYTLYKSTKQFEKSNQYYERYVAISDSLREKENLKNIAEMELRFEAEKKESRINELTQTNNILILSGEKKKNFVYGLIIIVILIISIGLLFFRQQRLKLKQDALKLEQKLLRTQMNPHFLFNSITSIESFIYNRQPKEAGDYLSRFARLMRLILENSANEYISLDKEVETLEYYLSLQKLRMDDNLDYSIEIASDIQSSQISLPPMLTQPFIENAIEHGFRGIKATGIIKIIFGVNKDVLHIKVIDNGIGIVAAKQQKDLYDTHRSMAMQITQERLKLLNKSKNKKMVFEVKEIEKGGKSGTEVTFSIPL
jgi:tetratricopeptide (TPR) repeat protein